MEKVKSCLGCGSQTQDIQDEYFCRYCGAPLINRCSSYDCQMSLPQDAAFCTKCGSKSIFLNAGLVEVKESKYKAIIVEDDDLPF